MKGLMKAALTAGATLFTVQALAQGPTLDTDKKKFSYTVGVNIGQSLKQDHLDVDVEVLNRAIADVLGGAQLKMTPEQMQAAVQQFQTQQAQQREAKAAENLKKGQEFLADNKKKPGIVQTASGLQYQVIKEGTGRKPKDDDVVVVNYRGTLLDGTEFDSSYSRGQPATFPVNGVIKGWREVLPLMKEGSKYKVFVPSDLAYGANGAGPIEPNSLLTFDIELLSIQSKPAAQPQSQPQSQPKAQPKG
jgi:FKBP-type peptidyl-prolyl cis-trans isomerase